MIAKGNEYVDAKRIWPTMWLHALDRKGQLKERWVLLSAVNSNKINDLDIGGDPSLLYWHWLDEYMRGASFEGEPPRETAIKSPL